MSENYCYQKFFNLIDTDSIELKNLRYRKRNTFPLFAFTQSRNLFDNPSAKRTRSINATWLDSRIDTEDDFKQLLSQLHDIGTIVIINDRKKCNNPIYKEYSKEMLKSYIKAFQDNGIKTLWAE